MTAGWRYVVAGGGLAMGVLVAVGLWQTAALDRAAFPLSQPTALQTGTGTAGGPVLWVLSVGVSHYAEADLNLAFADADARALSEQLQAAARRGPYREVRSLVLTDEQVTRESMLSGLSRFLGQAGPMTSRCSSSPATACATSPAAAITSSYPATADTLLADGLRMWTSTSRCASCAGTSALSS
jgi:hypothetical protein